MSEQQLDYMQPIAMLLASSRNSLKHVVCEANFLILSGPELQACRQKVANKNHATRSHH